MARISIEEVKNRLIEQELNFGAAKNSVSKKIKPNLEIVKFVKSLNKDNTILLFKKNDKFVLSPADDELKPIIGEFDEIPEDESMPPCLVDWLKACEQEISDFETKTNIKFGAGDAAMNLVDLGLSVKWADRNIDAVNPEDFGNYYAFGETETKSKFNWTTYKYYDADTSTCKDLGDNIQKNEDYDKAYLNDNTMCLPTSTQFQELITKCKWEKTTLNEVSVWKVTGVNGNFIYLPINGCSYDGKIQGKTNGYYWTSTSDTSNLSKANGVTITTSAKITALNKRTGVAIRPVSVEQFNVKKTIKTLIPFRWNQTSPFNSELPIDPVTKKTVVTGCNSTAMSQVIAYWGIVGVNGKTYKRGCTKTKAYTSLPSKEKKLAIPSLDPIAVFDYDNLLTTASAIKKSAAAKKAVGTLLKYTGYSIRSEYESNGTGAYASDDVVALTKNFRMGSNIKLIKASKVGIESFKEQIYKDLAQGHPVIMGGYNSSGKGGHCFICDGYDATTEKFHFNWGWGGQYDGWFEMTTLTPNSAQNYSYRKDAIINISPEYMLGDINNDGTVNITDVMQVLNNIITDTFTEISDVNSDGKVDADDAQLLIDNMLGNIKL